MKTLHNASWRIGCHAESPVSGSVKTIRSQSDLSKIEAGDILVAQQTDVNYAPYMIIASAIITVDGGRYSHAATFSRENGVPCMVGVAEALSELSDGDVVSIDTHAKTIVVSA